MHQSMDCIQEMHHRAENHYMDSVVDTVKRHTNRQIPVEQWPESITLLRNLATQNRPCTIKEVAHDVGAPEISTRGRLARLEGQGAVRSSKMLSILGSIKPVMCTHYEITAYGRDCAIQCDSPRAVSVMSNCINSIFSLGWAMKVNR